MSKSKANDKQKMIVYGITGMVGARIPQLLSGQFKIIGPPHSHLDLCDEKRVRQHIDDVAVDKILYVAGLTKVDQAQLNPKLAFRLNSGVVENITDHAAKRKIPVIYISTDAVFDGSQYDHPYKETDTPNPLSVYGKSKLVGEKAVLKSSRSNCIVRTIMVYSANYPHKQDFARLAYHCLKNHESFEGIADQIINPTFVDDLVNALAKILEKNARGIYHVAATDFTTNFGFVAKIAKIFNFNKSLITKTYFDEFFKDKPAPRTKCCWLDTTKFRKEFGRGILHTIDDSLKEFKKQIENQQTQPISL